MMSGNRAVAPDERGFTLIELLIYSVLSIIVLTVVAGFLINSPKTEQLVRDASAAAGEGQAVARSISTGIQQAAKVDLATPTADTYVVRAMVIDDPFSVPTGAYCQAWYFGDGVVRTTRSDSTIPVPTTTADVSGWSVIASGVEPVDAIPVFSLAGRTLEFSFNITTDGDPVLIGTTATSRQPEAVPTDVGTLCF
jgi:type II secretory pathway pseudopilin PulG